MANKVDVIIQPNPYDTQLTEIEDTKVYAIPGPTTYILFNRLYFKNFAGVLKLLEVALGMVCVALAGRNFSIDHNYLDEFKQITFLIITSSFMVGTYLVMLSSLLSKPFGELIGQTIYEILYNIHAGVLHLIVSSMVMSETQNYSGKKQYNVTMACAIVSMINAVFYFISAFTGHSKYKRYNYAYQ
ncbi:uncharacterized protein LOC129605608 [Condylostylus longicornis]|uniref:uncharacterized protein LOC129605608 n=1 Tax=Condylostylus longicornis TaxID=2530218 RepID=UPI00244DBDBF|nr:uncharacterized protein LOC129605608 [Condylostylus longicornis]